MARCENQLRALLVAKVPLADAVATVQATAQLGGSKGPSRSQAYKWADDWAAEREADTSGDWSLATDTTGHPDIVLGVVAGLFGAFGDLARLTHAEASWIVRIAVAVPRLLERQGERPSSAPEDNEPSLLALIYAQAYIDAAGDGERIRWLDHDLACRYAADGRWSTDWFRSAAFQRASGWGGGADAR